MNWTDLQEYGNRAVSVPFTLEVELSIPDDLLQTTRAREAALAAIEAEVSSWAVRLGLDYLGEERRLAAFAERRPEGQLLPWLGVPPLHRARASLAATPLYLVGEAHPVFPLVGQRHSFQLDVISIPGGLAPFHTYRPLVVSLESLQLVEGSLKAIFIGALSAAAVAIPVLTGTLNLRPIDDLIKDQQFQYEIRKKVAGQPCTLKVTFKPDLDHLRALGHRELNFDEPHISPEERALRTCNVQLALSVANNAISQIDGIWGKHSRSALQAYAAGKNTSANIADEALRGRLLNEFQNRSWRP